MTFRNEREFENYIRNLISHHISSADGNIQVLTNKKAVDIIICKENPNPHLFFIEVKYHVNSHGRLGFGSRGGDGFQPEILTKRPKYFEHNLRWVIASEEMDKIFFLTNEILCNYISGGKIGQKFNNIQKKMFTHEKGLTEEEFILELNNWLTK